MGTETSRRLTLRALFRWMGEAVLWCSFLYGEYYRIVADIKARAREIWRIQTTLPGRWGNTRPSTA